MRYPTLCAAFIITLFSATPAFARHHHVKHQHRVLDADPRPGAWCAWYLRRLLNIPRSAFHRDEWNLARAFRYIGSPAHGPAPGVIVVWRHHVGVITGRTGEGWVLKSGNDGGRVRERVRSLRGAIAFRYPPQRLASW